MSELLNLNDIGDILVANQDGVFNRFKVTDDEDIVWRGERRLAEQNLATWKGLKARRCFAMSERNGYGVF